MNYKTAYIELNSKFAGCVFYDTVEVKKENSGDYYNFYRNDNLVVSFMSSDYLTISLDENKSSYSEADGCIKIDVK